MSHTLCNPVLLFVIACLLPFYSPCELTYAVGQHPRYTQALQGALEAVLWLQSVPPRSRNPSRQHSLLPPASYSWCLPLALAACAAHYCHDKHFRNCECRCGTATCNSGGGLQLLWQRSGLHLRRHSSCVHVPHADCVVVMLYDVNL